MVRTGLADQAVGMVATVTVTMRSTGTWACTWSALDRIDPTGYAPNPQVGGQVGSS